MNMSRSGQVCHGPVDLAHSSVNSVVRVFCERKMTVNKDDEAQFWRLLLDDLHNRFCKKAHMQTAAKRHVSSAPSPVCVELLLDETRAASDEEGESNRAITANLSQGNGVHPPQQSPDHGIRFNQDYVIAARSLFQKWSDNSRRMLML